MNNFLLVLALTLIFVALGVQLVQTVRSDGYGKRPPPPSRHEEVAAPGYRSVV